MMKKLSKFLAAILCVIIAMSLFSCAKPIPNTATDVELVFWMSGNGRAYIDKMAAAFEKKNPGIKVYVTATAEVQNMTLYGSPETNTADLYLTTMENYAPYAKKYMEPLNDVLASKVDGNDTTIREKLNADVLKYMTIEDNIYTVPWSSSINGIMYNKGLFDKYGYKPARTTRELNDLALKIYSDGRTPFVHFMQYWRYITEAWMAQYDGIDAYFDKWSAGFTDENGVKTQRDIRAFTQQYDQNADGTYSGAYHSINALYELVSPKGYVLNGSNSFSHTQSQTYFLGDRALMMPNGSWVENEMKSAGEMSVALMKTPVISALGTKLGINERQLKTLVSLADGDTLTADELVLIADIGQETRDAVAFARNIHYTEMSQHHAFIPNYSIAEDSAKEFLKFYYSDEGLKIFAETTQMPLPAKLSNGSINTDGWSDFGKQTYLQSNNSNFIFKTLHDKLFYDGGILQLQHNIAAGDFTYGNDSSDVPDFIAREKKYWNNAWDSILLSAGLK